MAPGRKKAQTGGAETSNPPQKDIQVRIDPDLLNCSICFHPLCSPVNQCDNGHVACRTCWSKLKHKCHICKSLVVFRSIALDKILESVHVPCTYAHLGCRKYVSYSQRQVHTESCKFGPSLCPIPGCAHKASSGEWWRHFLKNHQYSCNHYRYGETCNVQFHGEDHYFTLFGPGKDLFLLVKEPIPNVGIAFSLYYIDLPDRGQFFFSYELEVVTLMNFSTRSVKLKSKAVSIKEWKRRKVCGHSLLVPLGFTKGNKNIIVINVLINK